MTYSSEGAVTLSGGPPVRCAELLIWAGKAHSLCSITGAEVPWVQAGARTCGGVLMTALPAVLRLLLPCFSCLVAVSAEHGLCVHIKKAGWSAAPSQFTLKPCRLPCDSERGLEGVGRLLSFGHSCHMSPVTMEIFIKMKPSTP